MGQYTRHANYKEFVLGEDTFGHDLKAFGDTTGKYMLWDASADTLYVLGALDFTGNLQLDGTLTVGVDDTGYDVTFYGATSGKKFFWDESADTAYLTCTVDIDGTVTVGVDDTGYDVKLFGATSGAYALWDESADELVISKGRMSFTGAVPADHVLDFSGVTLPGDTSLIIGGSYGTPLTYGAASNSLLNLYGLQTRDTGADVVTFFFLRGTGAAALIGDSALVENSATGVSYPKSLQGGQFMAGMTAAAKLATRGGDATAGMYGAWLKVYSAADCTLDSGSYTAAVWLDNQHSANTNNGTEYTIYSTTGGTVPDAWAGFATTSSGWSSLLLFEADIAPVGAAGLLNSGSIGKSLKVVVDSTTYYLALYDAA